MAAVVEISDKLDVVRKIPWHQTVQTSVDEHSQLEVDAFRRPQPVKVSQHRCNVLVPRRSMNQSGAGVEHRLKSTELRRGKQKMEPLFYRLPCMSNPFVSLENHSTMNIILVIIIVVVVVVVMWLLLL